MGRWSRRAAATALLVFSSIQSGLGVEHPGEAFLAEYCLDCHDDAAEKGERTFESLFFPLADEAGIIATQEIIDQLTLGQMPPPRKAQPSDQELVEAIAALTAEVQEAHGRLLSSGGQTVLRRLNEREYVNTLEDLFSRRVDTFDPTRNFPVDATLHHLDTIGDVLVTSSFLLENYLEAANEVVEKALSPVKQP
ncbi:MAG: DUF1587 domain-containing protein, partial [Verrucomicrobiota bacterium]